MIKPKAARRIEGDEEGQLFVQCTTHAEHVALLEAWRASSKTGESPADRPPCPMPSGHMMFHNPADYKCRAVTVTQVGPMLCVAEVYSAHDLLETIAKGTPKN